jgi:hypothetical protein
MPNGKIGDHPYTDIVLHGRRVYSEAADALVLEIDQLGGRHEVADLLWREFDQYKNPDIRRLEKVLTEIRDRLRGSSKA